MATTLDYEDKNIIGNASWKVLHAYSKQYPENPAQADKKEFHTLLKSVLRTIPDDDCKCRTHAVNYIQKYPPKIANRDDLVQWVCSFHNDVNRRLGKHEFDCKILFEKKPCKTCKPTQVIQDKDAQLKTVMGDYKSLSIKVFEEICKREALPTPTIVFAPCPTATHTSCTTMVVNKNTQDVNLKQKPVVYINPSNFGLRVLGHEAFHYIKKMKNENHLAIDEDEIEKLTQEIITKYFPADTYDKNTKQLIQPMVMKDSLLVAKQEKPTVEPMHNFEKSFNTKNFRRRYREAIPETFPMYSKFRQKHGNNIGDEPDEEGTHDDTSVPRGGILSYFDGIFEPFAKLLHIPAREVNIANTPNIFSGGVNVFINGNMSPFGSVVTTTLLGLGLFTAIAINKEGIGFEDRRLLTELGGLFLWSGLAHVNDKTVQQDARTAGSALAVMDFDTVKQLMGKQSMVTQAEAGIQARQQQRSSIGAGRSSGGTVGGIGRAVAQRQLEKDAGVSTRPEGGGIYKNFGSGAGVATPRNSGTGGVGFSYSPIIDNIGLSPEEKELLESQGSPTESLYYGDAEDLV